MSGQAIFWFRRDLRLDDNAGLYHALKSGLPVQPIFIFDPNILNKLEDKNDRRVSFIYERLDILNQHLQSLGSTLWVFNGDPRVVFQRLVDENLISALYANRDYEPYALKRDQQVFELLQKHHIAFKGYKDQVIFDRNEVLKDDGTPYTVFTPYSKKWKQKINEFFLKSYPTDRYYHAFSKSDKTQWVDLGEIGFTRHIKDWPNAEVDNDILMDYHQTRDYPGIKGTSKLSVHLRFGTISIRSLSRIASRSNEKYLNELIWREFYQYIIWHFPHVVSGSFKSEFDRIEWRNNPEWFQAWCVGQTGYSIVDAGMRELNATGYMHNRVRMIVASFLVKDLLIDWRLGEAWFARKLLDFDLASNNGGWQWAAGCGVDAAPYFRIFNPTIQTEKFDADRKYIKKWVPEYGSSNYPKPIVDHQEMKTKFLEMYRDSLNVTN